MRSDLESGRSGRMALYNEIADVEGKEQIGEFIYLAALDVADADNNIDDDEKKVLAKIAERLGLNPADYDDV